MNRILTALVLIAALGIGANAQAEPQTPAMAALERRIAWDAQHIRHLEHRRAYLHRYIRELRNPVVSASSSATTHTASSASYASNGWANELAAVGFPSSVIPTMEYIINRESGGNPSAVNSSSGACGLLQIFPAQPGCLDPMTNLRMGYAKYQAAGLAPWGM